MNKLTLAIILIVTSCTAEGKRFLSIKEAESRYGKIENGKWANQDKWMVRVPFPEGYDHLVYPPTGEKVKQLWVNRDMAKVLLKVLNELTDKGLNTELKTYWGCFNIRPVIGESRLSAHSYGLACDFNIKAYPLGSDKRFPAKVISIFKKHGFTYGGDWSGRPDPHHFSYSWE